MIGINMPENKADVIVIGGGIVGCSIALRMSEKGQSVILLEKERVGEEASGRNGGGVRQQDRHPAELPLAMEAVKIWARMKEELDCDVGYRRGGNIRYAHSEEKLEQLKRAAAREISAGLHVDILTPEETRYLTPSLGEKVELYGAKFCPSDGTANPLLVVKAIARAARRNDVQIKPHSPVLKFMCAQHKVISAITENEAYTGAVFINSAGPWAKGLCHTIGIDIPTTIKKESIIITEPIAPIMKQFVESDKFYYRQALEGNIHIAGDITNRPVSDFDKTVDFNSLVEIGRYLPDFLPIARKLNILRAFSGIIEYTPDEIPILDKAPGFDNFYITTGFSGHGFCLGPVIGKLISDLIIEGKSSLDLSAFRYSRFNDENCQSALKIDPLSASKIDPPPT
jgi:sarcosine oxidase, subunit beta